MAGDDRTLPGRIEGTDAVHIRTFLIADVRGYTLFTQDRGDEAAGKLAAKFAAITREVVEARDGTLLELRGDEALCVFASPRQAIRAAIELQERFVQETLIEPQLPLTVGIGLDAGEAVAIEGGYRGGALNLAARLCGQARAGEILGSREVTHLARAMDGVRYEDRGTLSLKGLTDPVTILRVVPEDLDAVERLRPFAPTPRVTRSRWMVIVPIALVVALVVVSIPLWRLGDDHTEIRTNSVARLDPEDGTVALATELGQRPGATAVGFGSIWVTQPDRGFVARLDLEDGSVTDTIEVGISPEDVAVGAGSVWVTNAGDGTVSRINPETNEETQVLDVGSGPSAIAVGEGVLWIADAIHNELARVEFETGAIQRVSLDAQPSGVAYTQTGVWVTSFAGESVALLDPASLEITLEQHVGSGPTSVISAFGSIWVANNIDGTVSRLDPSTGRVDATIPVGDGPHALAAAAGSMWVGNEYDGSVTAIDPTSNTVVRTMPLGASVASLTTVRDDLWLAAGASPTEHRGGTLTVTSAEPMWPSVDPAVVYDSAVMPVLSITNDGLLGYKNVGGADGATLVPDLATAFPEVSSDGLTYRFTLRQGIRYSTGEAVRPEDVRHALERSISLSTDFATLFGTIDGANACHADPATCDLSDSIVVDDDTVTFRLARPDPDFPYKLAFPAAYPVPSETEMADRGWDSVPATGPYTIAHVDARGMELVRNPAFREWSVAAQPDGFVDVIRWRFDVGVDRAFDQLEAGRVDWMTDPPASDDLESLLAAHPDQVVALPAPVTFYLGYDLHTPPFDDIRVRRAVNYAIDRDRVLELAGAPTTWRLTCQIFPPNFQGYEPFCPYTVDSGGGTWTAPDLERANSLIDAADARGQAVTVWRTDLEGFPNFKQTPPYVVGLLDELGLRARLRTVRSGKYFNAIYTGQSKVYVIAWIPDYPLAGGFILPLFQCAHPQNISGFCSPNLDDAIADAKRLQATDPAAANKAWTEIEHRLVEEAVWVPLLNPISTFAFSQRVGNIQINPQDLVLLSRLWVR